MLSDRCLSCLSCLSVCNVCALWPNGWTDQDETWHAGRPRPWPHCVRWGPRSPSPKGGQSPQFSVHVYCGQTSGWMKLVLGMEVGLSPRDFVLDGDPAPLPQRGAPQFSAHFYCDQTAGCIKMPLSMDVGLSPRDCVRWRPSPLSRTRGRSPPPPSPPVVSKRHFEDFKGCRLSRLRKQSK